MLEFSVADGLLLLGMPIVAAIVVALVLVLIARLRDEPMLTQDATLHMNEDGTLSAAAEGRAVEREHALAA